jgi:PTH1 family peptidyl-tRNA hydrolase
LALPHLLAGDMVKATQMIHTAKPPRPKPPRPATLLGTEKTEAGHAENTDAKGADPS